MTQVKTVLLLSPYKLNTNHQVLEILVIDRNASKSPFTNKELNSSELKTHFPEMPKSFKDILIWFNKSGIEFTSDEIKKKYQKQKSGKQFGEYYTSAMTRHMLDLFERIKPFAQTVQWYHKTPVDNIRYTTAACSISKFKPVLQFALTGSRNNILLQTIVSINGDLYNFDQFKRTGFLIESNNEYFLLGNKDTQTLNWLQENNPVQYANNPGNFLENILSILENDYHVERNGLFEADHVKVLPVNRVMLSEISNSFLMITPQWVYDGFVIEDKWIDHVKINRNSIEYLIHRNKEAEETFRNFLETLHPVFAKQMNGYYYLSFVEAQKNQWFPKAYHKLLSENIEVTGMDMLKHFRYSPDKVNTVSNFLREEGHYVILQLKISFGKEEIALTELQKMILAGQRAMLLKDGSLGILPEEWVSKYANIIKLGKIVKNEISVPRWLAFSNDDAVGMQTVIKS
ncbi:MAG TPA: hypothetical protein VK625_00745, partial [Flavitalea sp.]|nr:hypothetical protein [Flavitalea sp.]